MAEPGALAVLLVADFYWPYLGGVEQHVRSLAKGLAARGHEVTVATMAAEDLPRDEMDGAVRVRRIPTSAARIPGLFRHQHRPWAAPAPDPEATWALRSIVREARPNVVHGHDWLARSYLPLRRRDVPFVVSLHYYTLSCAKKNLLRDDAPCSGPGPLKCLRCATGHYGAAKGTVTAAANWAGASWERRSADLFLAVSAATAAGNGLRVGRSGRTAVEVVANFLPGPAPQDHPDQNVSALLHRLPADGFIMFVGDLRRQKGLDLLLEAYTGLVDPPPLVLIGKVWDETPTTFPPGVTVLTEWPNRAVIEAWRRCRFAVVPSAWAEPFGIVVIEAMSQAKPVVATRMGGLAELVDDGRTGLLVEPADPAALRAAMQRLIDDPDAVARMGAAAQVESARFAAATVIPVIEAHYRRLVAARASR